MPSKKKIVQRTKGGKVPQPCRRCAKPAKDCGYTPSRIRVGDWICRECADARAALKREGKRDPYLTRNADGRKVMGKKSVGKPAKVKAKRAKPIASDPKPTDSAPEPMLSTPAQPLEMAEPVAEAASA